MSSFLPKSVREELAAAQRLALRRKATRAVHVGDDAYPILKMTQTGFTVAIEDAPRLRGLVDIYEGARHMYQALIVASEEEGDVMRYDFKRNTAAATVAPVDFEAALNRPAGLLPSS